MSTQTSSGVEFYIVPEEQRQPFRLLELPIELVNSLSSDERFPLVLKSTDGSNDSIQESTVVLCTHNKTYQVRQVNTSNSLFVTSAEEDQFDSLKTFNRTRLTAISQLGSVIELLPADGNRSSADQYFQAILPIFTSTGLASQGQRIDKVKLFENVPFSDAECEQAWTDLACFEQIETACSFIPSISSRWQTWRTMKVCADAEGMDLTAALTDTQRTLLIKEADDVPAELASAILRSICASWTDKGFTVDKTKCARFVGIGVLADKGKNTDGVSSSLFLDAWKLELPTAWSDIASLELLAPFYKVDHEDGRLTYTDTSEQGDANISDKSKPATTGAKRNWHEKFRASKKTR